MGPEGLDKKILGSSGDRLRRALLVPGAQVSLGMGSWDPKVGSDKVWRRFQGI